MFPCFSDWVNSYYGWVIDICDLTEEEVADLNDIYSLEKILYEDELTRQANPCCVNCKNYFDDYGYSGCKCHDLPLENENTDKCKDWR